MARGAFLDLTQTFPRSPKEKMSGLVHVSRMIDKARAYKHKVLGEYIYPCPLDEYILDFLHIGAEDFADMADTREDTEIAQWIEEKCRSRSELEKDTVNRKILEQKPDSEKGLKKFREILSHIAPSRTDIRTWVDLIDLEEGRPVAG